MFSPLPVRLCFPYFSVISFPILAFGFSHLSSPAVLSPTDDLTIPEALSIFGFTASFSRLGCCGPRVVTRKKSLDVLIPIFHSRAGKTCGTSPEKKLSKYGQLAACIA
jgi:hypothetical protein